MGSAMRNCFVFPRSGPARRRWPSKMLASMVLLIVSPKCTLTGLLFHRSKQAHLYSKFAWHINQEISVASDCTQVAFLNTSCYSWMKHLTEMSHFLVINEPLILDFWKKASYKKRKAN